MKTTNINTALIDGYYQLLYNLSDLDKLSLISKLSLSVKANSSKRKKDFYKAFGAYDSSKSAEDIINEIRDSITFNRNIESF